MNNLPQRALIVRAPYAGYIVDGLKTMEMRSRHTNIGGRIAIAEQGAGLLIGEANLVVSVEFKPENLKNTYRQSLHKIEKKDWNLLDKWHFAWFMASATRYDKPIPYNHPQGAVTWVRL